MKPDFSQIISIAILALLLAFVAQVTNAQSKEKIEIKYKVDSIQIGNVYQYKIEVIVSKLQGTYNLSLFQMMPSKSYNLIEKKENLTVETSFFVTIGRKKWMVILDYNGQSEAKLLL